MSSPFVRLARTALAELAALPALVGLVVALGASVGSTSCGGHDPPYSPVDSEPRLSYSAIALPGDAVALTALYAQPWVLIATETEDSSAEAWGVERGDWPPLTVSALAVSEDGGRRTPLVRLLDGLDRTIGEPFIDDGGLIVAGATTVGEGYGRSRLEVVRWEPFGSLEVLYECELPLVRRGQLAIDEGVLSGLLEDESGRLLGLRTPLAEWECPPELELSVLPIGELPDDYRIDWLDDTWAVSGEWGETLAIQLFGRRFEPLRRLRLTSGGAVRTRDLSFARSQVGGWELVYVARVGGAFDVYQAPLTQWRAGPLADTRIVGTADIEREPVLVERGGRTVARWVVSDSTSGEWIELAGVVPPHGSALPGGEVVWRRPTGRGRVGRSVFTELGLLRVSVEPAVAGSLLVVSPYQPSFW